MKLWPLVVTGIIVFSYQQVIADDFKNAQRFDEGDVISADVLNEVLERIAAAQKTVATKDLVGSWSVKWRTCLNGGPGNCSSLNVGEGFSDSVDSLYRERLDNWEVSEDGDNTFSVEMKNYCTLSSAAYNNGSELVYYNLPCKARIAVLGDYVLFGYISSTVW